MDEAARAPWVEASKEDHARHAREMVDYYRGVQLRIDLPSDRGSAADGTLEISNLKPFSLTVSVTRNGAPFACWLQLFLLTDDNRAIAPFLADAGFPLLLLGDK